MVDYLERTEAVWEWVTPGDYGQYRSVEEAVGDFSRRLDLLVERPQVPTTIHPAPPYICSLNPTVYGWCNPVQDWFCWAPCGEVTTSVSHLFHPDGNYWFNHWNACRENLELHEIELDMRRRGIIQ